MTPLSGLCRTTLNVWTSQNMTRMMEQTCGRTRYCMEEHNYARNERICNSYIQLLTGYVITVCHNMYLYQITCSLVSSSKSESYCRLFPCHTDDKDPTHLNQEWTYNSNGTITSVMS